MFKVIGFMLLGVAIGWLLRKKKMPNFSPIILAFIALILLVLGVEVGGSDTGLGNIYWVIGGAFVVALLSTLGSVLFAAWLGRGEKKKEQVQEP